MKKQEIKLSEHFTYKKLFRFVFPSIIMMVFLSIYSIVDGLFVSNFVGKLEFASLNFIFPIVMGLGAIGLMIGTGGSALVGKLLGENNPKKANEIFSMLIYATIILGILLGVITNLFLPTVAIKLGATDKMFDFCIKYGSILLYALPFYMLQNIFQSFFITAEKPKLGLAVTIIAGFTNVILDYIYIVVLKYGIVGAALATAISQFIGGIIPIIYFARRNDSLLKLTTCKLYFKEFLFVLVNGSSEFMTNIALSVVTVLYNCQFLKYTGENGVAAYGTIMYIMFIFSAVYIGYSMGVAPLFSYNYGAKNDLELKNLTSKSLKIIGTVGILMFISAEILAYPLTKIFVGYDLELLKFTIQGFRLFALSFIIGGFNIFGSAFFTALNNGVVSATISFLRTLVFETTCVLTLPVIFGITGLWCSVTVAEFLALIISTVFFVKMRKRYRY